MSLIIGIDEVGRGPWAGPLVVGAVILPPSFQELPEYAKLRDSKKLSRAMRSQLAETIQKQAFFGLGWVSAAEIDRAGLSPALHLAARRAIKELSQDFQDPVKRKNLDYREDFGTEKAKIIIDGTINLLSNTQFSEQVSLLKKADDLVKEVSAASIVAKVARDRYMSDLDEQIPGYGFSSHVGYGTAAHRTALEKYGASVEHRQSFRPIAEIIARKNSSQESKQNPTSESEIFSETSTTIGHAAESAVAAYLESQNHTIIARNFKTRSCEIDIISTISNQLFFTEVKFSQAQKSAPLNRIDQAKLAKMQLAVDVFREQNADFADFQPLLAAASVTGAKYQNIEWFTIEN